VLYVKVRKEINRPDHEKLLEDAVRSGPVKTLWNAAALHQDQRVVAAVGEVSGAGDCIAFDIDYHPSCYSNYTIICSEKKDMEEEEKIYMKGYADAFDKLADEVQA
jgi:hypothetical protein